MNIFIHQLSNAMLLMGCGANYRANIRTTVLTYEPNEVRLAQNNNLRIVLNGSKWNEKLVYSREVLRLNRYFSLETGPAHSVEC